MMVRPTVELVAIGLGLVCLACHAGRNNTVVAPHSSDDHCLFHSSSKQGDRFKILSILISVIGIDLPREIYAGPQWPVTG
ncbi:hypothetical protein QBC35DRAFT_493267 [Podospora australis]|uniref:Secreted protein n=1 Tax=Podospora australis TaxID=1536484 RepID=A0AAN6WXQ1_9PEZI|nr:hypothetical protein QBC35DRAFT_493267 [Podospora australis]